MTIAVCMPMARAAHPNTMRCLLKLDLPRPYHFLDLVGFQVDVARNMLTETACSFDDVTHLLWIDDDMTFEEDAARRLLAHDLPIVGGLCFGRRHPYPPILVHLTERGYSFQYDYPEGLVEVDATGGAFLLVKKEVFYKIFEKDKIGAWSPLGVGEDMSFCRRARAVGYKVFVDTSVKIGHMGEACIEADYGKRNRAFEVNPWFPPRPIAEGAPVASIIIPTYNQKPAWLRSAVMSAIHQTVPVEIIVVDNGSSRCIWCDGPVHHEGGEGFSSVYTGCENAACSKAPLHPHLKELRVNENSGGPWLALNLGIASMTTAWFTWLSSDDLLYPHRIEKQLAATKAAGAQASFHGYDRMLHDWGIDQLVIEPYPWKTMEAQQKLLAQGCYINGLTVMLHRSVLDTVGSFDETFKISSDWHLWNKVARKFFWHPIPDILATRREYDNASKAYAKDPVKRELWILEDKRIREEFSKP